MRLDLKARPVRKRVWNAGRFFLLAAALATTFGVFFLASLRVATRAREVTVPDLRGQSVTDATTTLGQLGLVLRVDEPKRPDPKVPADHVLTQDPEPGIVLRRQRAVRVRVSDGQRDPVIPTVVDLPERTAEITLSAESIAIAARAEIRTPAYEQGLVVAQDPPAKRRGGKVTLLVNRGDKSVSYVMPDLIGTVGVRTLDVLRAQGFRVTVSSEVSYPGIPGGVVVRQVPQAGYQVTPFDAITIEVSR
jgi:beta-lactam-binding protein with PASTA domain